MKVGDNVICKKDVAFRFNNISNVTSYTIGNTYIINAIRKNISGNGNTIFMKDNYNNSFGYNTDNTQTKYVKFDEEFITLKEYRRNKLEKINEGNKSMYK